MMVNGMDGCEWGPALGRYDYFHPEGYLRMEDETQIAISLPFDTTIIAILSSEIQLNRLRDESGAKKVGQTEIMRLLNGVPVI